MKGPDVPSGGMTVNRVPDSGGCLPSVGGKSETAATPACRYVANPYRDVAGGRNSPGTARFSSGSPRNCTWRDDRAADFVSADGPSSPADAPDSRTSSEEERPARRRRLVHCGKVVCENPEECVRFVPGGFPVQGSRLQWRCAERRSDSPKRLGPPSRPRRTGTNNHGGGNTVGERFNRAASSNSLCMGVILSGAERSPRM